LLEFNLAAGDSVNSGSAARTYEIGVVGSVPIPQLADIGETSKYNALEIWRRKARIDSREETSRYFLFPWPVLQLPASVGELVLQVRNTNFNSFVEILGDMSGSQFEMKKLYGFDFESITACEAEFGPDVTSYASISSPEVCKGISELWSGSLSDLINSTSEALGHSRFISKMTFVADRRLELLCHRFKVHPTVVAQVVGNLSPSASEGSELVSVLLSFFVGTVFGRWDIRFSIGECQLHVLPDPFAHLPVCPPGMLQNAEGLPAEQKDVPPNYPLRITWSGILVDDENHHEDIVARIRKGLEVVWSDGAEAIETEVCSLLGVKTLRDYFRRPSGFFADHLQRYSKSRRQAPIYWPLSTAKGSYTLWIYYHRLTDQTLHTALADFIEPKLKTVRAEICALRESATLRSRLEELQDLEKELIEFRDEIERIIKLPWKPNLNDGVLITASPLSKLFRLPKWQKDIKTCWEKLEKGDFDWAHLAYSIWPKRVEDVCQKDRSVAIAHGLEHLCEAKQPKAKGKKRRGKKSA